MVSKFLIILAVCISFDASVCRAQLTQIVIGGPAPADEAKTLLAEATRKPMEMRFKALDGREVDLAKLRNKVILIDFSAFTWCGPCRRAEPFVTEAYKKYHDKGLEVVGFALEYKPEDKGFIEDYFKKQGITWPTFFEGKGMENEYVKLLGVRFLPMTYLIDKQGLLVATGINGPILEPLIRRYLGLPSLPGDDEVEAVVDTLDAKAKQELRDKEPPMSIDVIKQAMELRRAGKSKVEHAKAVRRATNAWTVMKILSTQSGVIRNVDQLLPVMANSELRASNADIAFVKAHIKELKEIGVPEPPDPIVDTAGSKDSTASLPLSYSPSPSGLTIDLARKVVASLLQLDSLKKANPQLKIPDTIAFLSTPLSKEINGKDMKPNFLSLEEVSGKYMNALDQVPEAVVALKKLGLTTKQYSESYIRILYARDIYGAIQSYLIFVPIKDIAEQMEKTPDLGYQGLAEDLEFVHQFNADLKKAGFEDPISVEGKWITLKNPK